MKILTKTQYLVIFLPFFDPIAFLPFYLSFVYKISAILYANPVLMFSKTAFNSHGKFVRGSHV